MRMPAMVQQVADWRRRDPGIREIEVGKVCRDDAGTDEQRTLPCRAPATHGEICQGNADESMRDVVHGAVVGG